MFVVSFRRRDGQPNEEYYYRNAEDADIHFNLFKGDDSDLYEAIELLEVFKNQKLTLSKLVRVIEFST